MATVVGLVAQDVPWDRILADYPDLVRADIVEALEYAADAVRERAIPLNKAG